MLYEVGDRLLSERDVYFELVLALWSRNILKLAINTRKQDGSSFFFPLKFSSINAVQNVIEISLLSVSDDLVLSTELIM